MQVNAFQVDTETEDLEKIYEETDRIYKSAAV